MNLLKKIEALFSNAENTNESATVENKFTDVKAQDGSLLRISDEVAVGAKVEVINEDGTLTVPTSTSITLEDGTVLELDPNGLILEISSPTEEASEGEMAEAEAPAEQATEDNTDSDTNKRIDALESKVTELINAVNSLIEAQSKNSEMESEMAALKAENEDLSKKASAPAANFKKFDKTIEIKIAKPEDNSTMARLLKRKNNQ